MAKDSSAENRRNKARENARQIAAAQAKKEKTAKTILYSGIAVVIVVVAAIIGVLIFNQSKPGATAMNFVSNGITVGKDAALVQPLTPPKEPTDSDSASLKNLPTADSTGTKKNAATVTVYLDFQCPGCQAFEQTNVDMLTKLANEGSIVLNYKPIAILDRMSSGNEYSTRSANLAYCAIDSQPETAVKLFSGLFAQQPEEGGNGRTDDELLKVAEDAGVDTSKKLTSDPNLTVAQCVTDQTFKKAVTTATQASLDEGVASTPWVLVNGKKTENVGDPEALALEILKATGEVKG